MECRTYLEQIAAHVDNALGADDAAAAREHLSACPACAMKYQWEDRAAGVLKAKLLSLEPSSFLRQRIEACLEDTGPAMRLSRYPFQLTAIAGAAIVLLLLVPYVLLRQGGGHANLFAGVVASYQEVGRGVRGEALSPQPSAMLLDLSPWGYRLLSRRLDTVDGRPAQISVYQGDVTGYLMAQEFEDPGFAIPVEARVVDDGAISFLTYERDGVNLVAWRERGVLCVIASSQSKSDLLTLAKRIAVRG